MKVEKRWETAEADTCCNCYRFAAAYISFARIDGVRLCSECLAKLTKMLLRRWLDDE